MLIQKSLRLRYEPIRRSFTLISTSWMGMYCRNGLLPFQLDLGMRRAQLIMAKPTRRLLD